MLLSCICHFHGCLFFIKGTILGLTILTAISVQILFYLFIYYYFFHSRIWKNFIFISLCGVRVLNPWKRKEYMLLAFLTSCWSDWNYGFEWQLAVNVASMTYWTMFFETKVMPREILEVWQNRTVDHHVSWNGWVAFLTVKPDQFQITPFCYQFKWCLIRCFSFSSCEGNYFPWTLLVIFYYGWWIGLF